MSAWASSHADTLRAEIAEALAGARQYFEVLSAEELLQGA